MAETLIQWTQSAPLPHDVVLPRTMRVPGLNEGKALPEGHVLPAGSRVGGYTLNFWLGCTKVSPGCAHCYAENDLAVSLRKGGKVQWGPGAERVLVSKATRRRPLAWNRTAEVLGVPLFVFAQSLSDTFEDRADLEGWRLELFELIRQTPNLRWLMLTKRPEVMARFAAEHGWPENAWAGCTVEDQRRADERIPHLLRVPAPVRFLSCEPLLGPVDLTTTTEDEWVMGDHAYWRRRLWDCTGCGGSGYRQVDPFIVYCGECEGRRTGIHWLIIGGESGPHARPMHPDWARSLIRQGVDAGVAVHFKQWGEWAPMSVSKMVDIAIDEGRQLKEWELSRWHETHYSDLLREMHSFVFSMFRLGKKAAGRVIDGRTWDEVPHV